MATQNVSVESIVDNAQALSPAEKFMWEHGYPEEHKLPETITVTRNGIVMEYTFTERDRLLAKGKGLPYWMLDMSQDLNKIITHIGEKVAYDAIKAHWITVMQDVTNPEKNKELWSEDRTRIDDEVLIKAIQGLTAERETIGGLQKRLEEITGKELPGVMMKVASGDSNAIERQDRLMEEIKSIVLKQGELRMAKSTK